MSAKICKEYNKIVNTIKTSNLIHLESCRNMIVNFNLKWKDEVQSKKLKDLVEKRQQDLKTELIIKTKKS